MAEGYDDTVSHCLQWTKVSATTVGKTKTVGHYFTLPTV
jgi:hypothetical protein